MIDVVDHKLSVVVIVFFDCFLVYINLFSPSLPPLPPGPKSPFLPTRITAGNFAYSSAVIQWTVPSIAYSPETYFIRYGTGKSNLNLKSEVLQGTQNLNAKDQTLSITLRYLTHDTRYYFQVVSNNTNGQTESAEHEFSTSRLGKSCPLSSSVWNTSSLSLSLSILV